MFSYIPYILYIIYLYTLYIILIYLIYYSTIWYILRADILRVVQDFFKPSISDEKKRAISLFSILILVFEIPPTALFVDHIDCIMSSLKDENNANETIKVFFVTS